MNYIKISNFDTANGDGIGVVLWVSGCEHHCPQCHNPQTWDKNVGKKFTEETLNELDKLLSNEHIKRLTVSGGDPLATFNRNTIYKILKHVKEKFPSKKVWCYTGYTFEDILYWEPPTKCLEYIDVLVDGRFIKDLKDVSLKFRGSSNQRLINVKKSLELTDIILY